MSDSRPPLPLILAGGVSLAVLAALGLNALRSDERGGETALAAQPAPKLDLPQSAPQVVGGPVAIPDAGGAHQEMLRVARDLLSRGDEGAALDLIDDALEDAGPEPGLLRFREALLSACEGLLESEQAAIRADLAAGRSSEAQVRLATLLRRLPGSYQGALSALSVEVGAARGGDLAADRLELERRQRTLATSPSPEASYELALWARDRGFLSESQALLAQTVALDGFHEGARQALGHRKHEGRWYSDDEYKTQVLGLVRGPDGRWAPRPEETTTASAGPAVTPTPAVDKEPLVPPPPPSPYQEDKEWYQDPDAKACAWEQAEVYKTKYYLIKTNVKPEYAKRYGKMMDQYFKRFVSVFKDFLPETGYERSEIYIHASKPEFHEQNPQVPKTAGGFYSPQTKRVVAYHGLFGGQGTTRDVLAHEGTHQFEDIVLRGKFWNCPIWIIEGLAVYFESAYFNGSEVKIGLVPRERLWSLKRGLASNSLIPLRTLIRTPQRQFGGYHYAHAWSLIYMVIYGNKSKKLRQKNRQWFSDLFMSALQGQVTPEQVEQQLGGKEAFDELEAAWKEWIAELPYDYKPPR